MDCALCGSPVREGGGCIVFEHFDGRYEHIGYCIKHRDAVISTKLGTGS